MHHMDYEVFTGALQEYLESKHQMAPQRGGDGVKSIMQIASTF